MKDNHEKVFTDIEIPVVYDDSVQNSTIWRNKYMKIVILGAGSLGCAIGGTLAKGGSEVYLINRRVEHIDAINQNGLHMTDEKKDWYVKADGRTSAAGIGQSDLVIVLVKSFATQKAVTELKETGVIGTDTMLLSLQNGLGNEEMIASVVGREHVICGKTYVGGRLLKPGFVSASISGKYTYIGEMNGEFTERIQTVSDEFNRAGLLCEVSKNIQGLIWDKLLINVAAGALCGITRLPYGPLYEEENIKETAIEAVKEGIAVAKAAGVRLKSEEPEYSWYAAAEGLPATFKTSILQSLESKRPTEIGFINGAVVEWGRKYGIPTPVNQTLTACVKGIEKYLLSYEPSLKGTEY